VYSKIISKHQIVKTNLSNMIFFFFFHFSVIVLEEFPIPEILAFDGFHVELRVVFADSVGLVLVAFGFQF